MVLPQSSWARIRDECPLDLGNEERDTVTVRSVCRPVSAERLLATKAVTIKMVAAFVFSS